MDGFEPHNSFTLELCFRPSPGTKEILVGLRQSSHQGGIGGFSKNPSKSTGQFCAVMRRTSQAQTEMIAVPFHSPPRVEAHKDFHVSWRAGFGECAMKQARDTATLKSLAGARESACLRKSITLVVTTCGVLIGVIWSEIEKPARL